MKTVNNEGKWNLLLYKKSQKAALYRKYIFGKTIGGGLAKLTPFPPPPPPSFLGIKQEKAVVITYTHTANINTFENWPTSYF